MRLRCVLPPYLADAVNGSEHVDSYMALATEREPTTYSSLQMLHWAILAYYEPMPTRLVRGRIAMAFTARVPVECMQPPC